MSETVSIVVGLDLSLTSSGVAALHLDTNEMAALAVTSTGHSRDPLRTHATRASDCAEQIIRYVDACQPVLVVVESAYFNTGAADTSAHRRAGLWWMVVADLNTRYPVAEVAPATLKKFVTGSGTASKGAMEMAIAARFGASVLGDDAGSTDDCADAAGLAAMGSYAAGVESMPRNARRNATMGAVAWPEVETIGGHHG